MGRREGVEQPVKVRVGGLHQCFSTHWGFYFSRKSPTHTPTSSKSLYPSCAALVMGAFFSKLKKKIICLLWLPPVDSQPYEIGCRSNFVHHYTFCCCLVDQLCLTFCDHMDCRLPGSSAPGISQARTLEWVAVSFSRGASWPRDRTCVFCIGRQILYY